jgi:hypothetical protein
MEWGTSRVKKLKSSEVFKKWLAKIDCFGFSEKEMKKAFDRGRKFEKQKIYEMLKKASKE